MSESANEKTKEIINAPAGTRYLSGIMEELPTNCLFNKGKTGCGGTELVLRGNKNAIVAVPYVALIKNKILPNGEHGDRSDQILGVYKGVEDSTIIDYLNTRKVKKIMVTYDSLPRITRLIQQLDKDEERVFNDYFLLVDEWHCLFKFYRFRTKAIRGLLAIAPRFKRVTYMTATPFKNPFLLVELEHLPVKEVQWEERSNLDVNFIQTPNVTRTLAGILQAAQPSLNLHVFFNSVSGIASVLEEMNLPADRVKVVCSTSNDENERKLQAINPGYTIEEPDSPPKRFNFYTSTCFEGCDIHDPNGLAFVANDAGKKQTLLDINTTVVQVCGRLRDSNFANQLYYIYSTEKKPDTSSTDYAQRLIKEYDENEKFVADLNTLPPDSRKRVWEYIQYKINNNKDDNNDAARPVYMDDSGTLICDRNMLRFDVYDYHVKKYLFSDKNKLKKVFEDNGNIIVNDCYHQPAAKESTKKEKTETDHKDLFERYHASRAPLIAFDMTGGEFTKDVIAREYPEVKEAYETLGIDKIRELEYGIKKIKKEIVKRDTSSNESKVITLISKRIELTHRYKTSELNAIIRAICEEYGLRKIPASKLKEYFVVEEKQLKIDGKTTKCMTLIQRKAI